MKARIELILKVDYELNSASFEDMKRELQSLVFNAAGNGLLSGETDAEVETWQADITGREYELSEEGIELPVM